MTRDKSFDYVIKYKPPSSDQQAEAAVPKRITVVDKTHLKGQKRREVIARIFDEKKEELKGRNKITITSWNPDQQLVRYKIQGRNAVETIKVAGGDSSPAVDVHLAIKEEAAETTGEYVGARLSAFANSYRKLFAENLAGNIGIVAWWCLILPVWAIIDSMNALQDDARKPFLEEVSPSGPEGFFEALKTMTEILQTELEGQDISALSQLEVGIARGQRLLRSVDDPAARGNLYEEIRGEIEASDETHPVLLPVGYYSDQGYHSALLSIYKSGDNYVIQKFSLACEDPAHTGKLVPMLEYELLSDEFASFFTNLAALQKAPQKITATPEQKKQLAALGARPEQARAVEAVSDPLAAILGSAKESKDASRMRPSDDPWKLMFAWLKTSDPELIKDKTEFMTLVMEHSTSHIFRYFDRLSPDQKEICLQLLDKRLEKLEGALRKKDPEIAKELLGPLKKKIHRAAITPLQETLRQRDIAKRTVLTQPMPPASIRLTWRESLHATLATDAEALKEKSTAGIYAFSEQMESLDKIFRLSTTAEKVEPPSSEEAAQAIKDIKTLSAKVEGLLEAQDYRKARTAAAVTLSCLPSMDTPELWKNFSLEQMNELSLLIEKTSGQLFEAKFRLGDGNLWPDELVHIWNAKAVLLSVARERYEQLREEARQAYLKNPATGNKFALDNPDKKAWDDFFDKTEISKLAPFLAELKISFEMAEALCFRDYTLESAKFCHLLEKDPYLHFGEDPILDRKASALLKFFKNDRKERIPVLLNAFESKKLHQTTDELLKTSIAPIRTAYGKSITNLEEFTKLAITEIERTNDPIHEQRLPSFLIDIRRHEVWSDALFNPKGSLYLCFPSNAKGKLRAFNWISTTVNKAKEGSADRSEIAMRVRDQQYSDIRKRLGEMGRLTLKIATTVFDEERPVVQILSDPTFVPDSSSSPESQYGLCLFPRQLPGKFAEIDMPEDPHLFQPVLGFMPESVAVIEVNADSGWIPIEEPSEGKTAPLLSFNDPSVSQKPAELFLRAAEGAIFSDMDPLDRYRVMALKSARPYFTSFKVWMLIETSPHLIDNPIIQNRLLHLLFSNQALKTQLFLTPLQFTRIARNLDAQIDESLEKGNLVRAGFLSFLSQRLKQGAVEGVSFWQKIEAQDKEALQKLYEWENASGLIGSELGDEKEEYNLAAVERAQHRIKELQTLIPSLPSADKEYEVLSSEKKEVKTSVQKELLEAFNPPRADADLKSLSLFFLAGIDESSVSTMTPEEAASVLKAWEVLRSAQTDISIPNLRELLIMRMEKTLLPLFAKRMGKEEKFRTELLNRWTGVAYQNWKVSSDNPCKFLVEGPEGNEEASADIATCEVSLPIKHERAIGLRFPIPDEIASDSRYYTLFGKERFSAAITVSKGNPSIQECRFELNGREFTLVYDRKKKELNVFQTVKGIQFRYTEPVCSEKSNFAKAIQHYGIWVNEQRPRQALLFPGKMQEWKSQADLLKDAFNISLGESGNVISITNSKGMRVIQDSLHTAAPYFAFVEDGDLIFLGQGEENTIKRVRLLKEKLEFEVSADGTLRPLDKEPGWECWFYDTERLAELFGPAHEQYMIALRKGNEAELRLFPHAINPLRIRGETESMLDFDKKAPWDSSLPTLAIKIDDQGRMHGSHAAFLYLAYVAFAQGQLDRAAIYLEEASRADKTDPKEIEVIQFILSMLHEQPHPTAKTVAFQLKAEMTIRRILRDYYHVPEFRPESWEAHSKEIERILTLHGEYEEAERNSVKSQQLRASKLLLTEEETAEFERFRAGSIHTLLALEESRPAAPAAEEIHLRRPMTVFDSPQFMSHLILWMEPANSEATKEGILSMGLSPTPENVLKHFWTYWEAISKGVISPDDLSPLMLPMRAAKGSDPALIEAVDFARRMLFTYSQYVEKFPKVIADKKEEIGRLKEKLLQHETDQREISKEITETTESEVEATKKKIEALKTTIPQIPTTSALEEEIDGLKRIYEILSKAIEASASESELLSEEETSEEISVVKGFGKTLDLSSIEIDELSPRDLPSLKKLSLLAESRIQKKSEELEEVHKEIMRARELGESIQIDISKLNEEYQKNKKLLDSNKSILTTIEMTNSLLQSKRTELKFLESQSKNLGSIFPAPKRAVFREKQNLAPEEIRMLETSGFGINTVINLYRQSKLSTHQNALQRLSTAVQSPLSEMLQGMNKKFGVFDLILPGAEKIVPSDLRASTREAAAPPSTELSLEEFRQRVDQPDLPEEERTLYLNAIDRIGKSEEKQPVHDLLRRLLKEGGMPMVALHRFNALRGAIAKKETAASEPLVIVESAIALEARPPSRFQGFFTADLRLPTDGQLQRLSEVFNQRPRHGLAWLQTYRQICAADASQRPLLEAEIKKEPAQLSRSKDVAQSLLSAAAAIKLAELNNPVAATSLPDPATFAPTGRIAKNSLTPLTQAFETHLKAEQKALIDERCDMAKSPFIDVPATTPEDEVLMVAHENKRFRDGLDEAAAKKKAMVDSKKGYISDRQVEPLIRQLRTDIRSTRESLKVSQQEIFEAFAPFAKEFGLEEMFARPEKYTVLEKMNAIIDLCEDGRLSSEIGDTEKRDRLLTLVAKYLFAATEMQQKEKALDDAAKLAPLAKKRESLQLQLKAINAQISKLGGSEKTKGKREALAQESAELKVKMTEIEIEWRELSSSIEGKIDAGENDRRFSDGDYKRTVLRVLTQKIDQFTGERKTILENIHSLEEKIAKIIGDTPEKKVLQAKLEQLNAQSSDLKKQIEELQNRHDKVDKQTGDIIDQEQTLPYLVREYRQNLVFTTAQIEKIETILDDPNALEEFRMGLGKSSVIFPCVARILISRGKFPIVLFTEELIEQSRRDMDKKAYFFQFNRNSSVTPEDLAEEYHTLLSVKRSKRYVITTVERVAALENKIIELEKSLKDTWLIYQDKEDEKLFLEMSKTLEQLFWLKKISSVFDHEDTRIVADEIDEIFSILSEKNYSDGELSNINRIAFDSGERIFQHILSSTNETIATFQNDLATDKLSNYSKEKVQEVMKALAEAIYDDEKFWTDIQWGEEKRPDREEFAIFLSDLKSEKLPAGMPEWPKSSTDKTALQKLAAIGALRHWMTKTMPTLCEKQDGKDYGFGPDGYSVVPRKEQREKPNTKFGQEAELIGYHFLAYIRNGQNDLLDAFFISQIPDILNRASKESVIAAEEGKQSVEPLRSPWRTWLSVLDPHGTGDSSTILKNFRKPESDAQRMQFLRFIMQESPRIQVYTSQLARNVQDTILGRKVAGAAGTMSRYSLPNQFSYDRSKDARTGTGDTLLRLALMGKGFDEEVGSFNNLMVKMTELTRDAQCKAIINQGYATPNMASYDVIKRFREEELEAIRSGKMKLEDRRQYIFVEAKSKQAYLWMPDASNPAPFDKDLDAKKISSRHVLYYFGPADTRGTDFKIPYGYGALIVGPTTTTDEFDQAIWRLRLLGQGQDSKIFAEETHIKRFTPIGEEKALVKHLISDIELRGVQTNATVNLKAASARPEAALRQEVKKAIFTPLGTSERFLKAKQDKTARQELKKEMEGTAKSFETVETLFVRSKALNFESDYTPSVMIDIMPYLDVKYEKVLQKVGSDDTSGILHDLPEHSAEKDLGTQRVEALRSKVHLAKRNIAEERDQVNKDSEFHTEFLQAKVSSSETGQKDAQAEVQEQQQQQQQEQTQLQQEQKTPGKLDVLSTASRGSASEYDIPIFSFYLNPQVMSGFKSSIFSMEALYPDCGIGTNIPINLSQSMREWMKVCPPIGRSTGFLVMYKHGDGEAPEDWVATWMTDLDYENLVSTMMARPEIIPNCFSVLSVPEKAAEPEVLFNLNPIEGKNHDELLLAIAKLTMGYTNYPEGERKKLFEWYTKLSEKEKSNWIAILDQRQASKTCVEMLSSWSKATTYVPAPMISEEPPKIESRPSIPQRTAAQPVKQRTPPRREKESVATTTQKVSPPRDHRSVGGAGKCADYSMKDQLSQLGYTNVTLRDLRVAAGSYLENNKVAIAGNQPWMNEIKTALMDAPDRPSTINSSNIDTLDSKELVSAYAKYIQKSNTWWDAAAFRALAANRAKIMPGMQIAIVQDSIDRNYSIHVQFPDNEKLNPEKCLFIWYNQGSRSLGNHYHSFHRNAVKLHAAIEAHPLTYFENFMERLEKTDDQGEVKGTLRELSIHDPISYHAICYLIWANDKPEQLDYLRYAQRKINESDNLRNLLGDAEIDKDKIKNEKDNFSLQDGRVVREQT